MIIPSTRTVCAQVCLGLISLLIFLPVLASPVGASDKAFSSIHGGLNSKSQQDKHAVDDLNKLAHTYLGTSPDQSRQTAFDALRIAEEIQYLEGMAEAHRLIAFGYQRSGNLIDDLPHLELALDLARQSGGTKTEVDALSTIGIHHHDLNNHEIAINYYLESRSLARKIGYKSSEASSNNNIGFLLIQQSAFEAARRYLEDALSIYDEIGQERKQIFALANHGQVLLEMGLYDAAARSLYRARDLSVQYENHAGMTIALVQISRLHRSQNNDGAAIKTLVALLENEFSQGFPEFIAEGYVELGEIYEDRKELERAVQTYRAGLRVLGENGAADQRLILTRKLSGVLQMKGDFRLSLKYLADFIDLGKRAQGEDQSSVVLHLRERLKFLDRDRQLAAEKQYSDLQAVEIARQQAVTRGAVIALVLSLATIGSLSFGLHTHRKSLRTIGLKNEELSTLSAEVMELSESRSRLIANTGHDLRTPLNGIIGIATLLEREDLSPAQKKYVNALTVSADKLRSLMDDILDISQLESGVVTMESKTVSVHDHLARVLESFGYQAAEKNTVLTEVYTDNLPSSVHYPSDRVAQVLGNLISNAIKFTEGGSICVSVDQPSEEWLRYSVIDTGIGIPLEDQEALFERFSQTDIGADKKYDGLGLGLAICREFTQLWGGEIGLESTPGTGSCFWFTVPIELPEQDLALAEIC